MLSAAIICLAFAVLPLVMTVVNLAFYRPLPVSVVTGEPVSVLIPARDEADRIGPVLTAALATDYDTVEIIIGDDNSTDGTDRIVKRLAEDDRRLRLVSIEPAATDGWAGKNNACQQLAASAKHDLLVFVDADVVLERDALARIAAWFRAMPDHSLLSGFPRQVTGTLWEKLLIPLIHMLVLGFLPFAGVRFTRHPMFGTACGQLIAVRKTAYARSGGHAAFKPLLHDGLHLPRSLRSAGFATGLADLTDICSTRMYTNWADLKAGLMKNAHEAMATSVGLPVWTVLLGLGQVLPVMLLALVLTFAGWSGAMLVLLVATLCGFGLRLLLALWFGQSLIGVALHPFSVAVLLWLQWLALINRRRGGKVVWKGRQY